MRRLAPAAVLAGLVATAPVFVPAHAFAQGHTDTPRPRIARAARPSNGPAGAVMPGFETLADGSSRLFVELSKPVAFETKTARGSVTYVLKGVRVLKRNNTNPLVTLHFNTPVTTARLVPHGGDLWFVVELRASVQPAVTMDAGKDGSAVMHIELPKGDYLPATRSARVPPAKSPNTTPPTSSAAPVSGNAQPS